MGIKDLFRKKTPEDKAAEAEEKERKKKIKQEKAEREKKEKLMDADTLTKKIKNYFEKKFATKATDYKTVTQVTNIMNCIRKMQKILPQVQAFIYVSSDWIKNISKETVKKTKKKAKDTVWGAVSTASNVNSEQEWVLKSETIDKYEVKPVKLPHNGGPETTKTVSEWRLYCVHKQPIEKLNKYVNVFNKRVEVLDELSNGVGKNPKNIKTIISKVQKHFIGSTRLSNLLQLPSGPDNDYKEKCLVDLKKSYSDLLSLAGEKFLEDNKLKDYLRGIIYQYKGYLVWAKDNPEKCGLFHKLISNKLAGKDHREKQLKDEKIEKELEENPKHHQILRWKEGSEQKALDLSKKQTKEAAIKYWQTIVITAKDIYMFEKICNDTRVNSRLKSYVNYMVRIVAYVDNLDIDKEIIDTKEVDEIKKACGVDKFESAILNKKLRQAINKINPSKLLNKLSNWIGTFFKTKDKQQVKIEELLVELNKKSEIFKELRDKLTSDNLVNLDTLDAIHKQLSSSEVDTFIDSFEDLQSKIDKYEDTANKKNKTPWLESARETLNTIGYTVFASLSEFHLRAAEAREKFLQSFGNEKINWNDCIFYTTIVDLNAKFEEGSFLRNMNLGSLNLAVFLHSSTNSIKIGPSQGLFDYLTKDIVKNLKTDSGLANAGLCLLGTGVKGWFEAGTTIGNIFAGDKLKDVMNWRKADMKLDIKQVTPVPMFGFSGSELDKPYAHKVQDVALSITNKMFEMEPYMVSFSIYLIATGRTMKSLVKVLPTNLKDFVDKDLGINIDLSKPDWHAWDDDIDFNKVSSKSGEKE